MQTGLLLNSLICFIISGISFWVFYTIIKSEGLKQEDKYFSFFWLFVSLTWFFVAMGLVFFERNKTGYDLLINKYAVQPLIFLHLSLGVTYAFSRFCKAKICNLAILCLALLASAYALYIIFQPAGFHLVEYTYFSVEYYINPSSWGLFQVIITLGLSVLVLDILRSIWKNLKTKKIIQNKYFLASLSIFVYAIIGYFDNQGYNATWIMVFFRLMIILSALLAFLAFNSKKSST